MRAGGSAPRPPKSVVQSFVEHWGDNLQFYPNFALFSTLGEMNLDQDFSQVSKLSENQNKDLHQKWNTFFPQIQEETKKEKFFTRNGTLFLSTDLRSDAHQSQIIGDADEDHTQTVGGLQSNY